MRPLVVPALAASLLAALFVAPAAVLAAGASITVNTLSDSSGAGDGTCSLREAINAANLNGSNTNNDCPDGSAVEPDEITFSAGGTITLTSSLPAITDSVTFRGGGVTVIDGDNLHRLFLVTSGTVVFDALTLQHGLVQGTFAFGGAISNGGTVTIVDSTIRASRATSGGGIHNNGSMAIWSSTIEGNSTTGIGGGIYNENSLQLLNATVTGNTAAEGGGIYTSGQVEVVHGTIVRNTAASGQGGGLKRAAGTAVISNSVVVGNVGGQRVGSPTINSSVIVTSADGVVDTALRANGGPTKTIRLPAGSSALGVGQAGFCDYAGRVDQRGLARPATGSCDAGAVQRDRVKPYVIDKPIVDLEPDRSLKDGRISIRLLWYFADAGIGIERFSLQRQVNGGSWTTVSTSIKPDPVVDAGARVTPVAVGTSAVVGGREGRYYPSFTSGKSYRFRVRAVDEDGNVSDWAYSPTRTARLYQQTSTALKFSSGWTTATSTKFSGGSVKYASTTGRYVDFTYTGRDVNLVTSWRATPFQFEGIVGGVTVTTDSKSSSPSVYQRQVYLYRAPYATRTIRIRLLADARLDIDGFVVLR